MGLDNFFDKTELFEEMFNKFIPNYYCFDARHMIEQRLEDSLKLLAEDLREDSDIQKNIDDIIWIGDCVGDLCNALREIVPGLKSYWKNVSADGLYLECVDRLREQYDLVHKRFDKETAFMLMPKKLDREDVDQFVLEFFDKVFGFAEYRRSSLVFNVKPPAHEYEQWVERFRSIIQKVLVLTHLKFQAKIQVHENVNIFGKSFSVFIYCEEFQKTLILLYVLITQLKKAFDGMSVNKLIENFKKIDKGREVDFTSQVAKIDFDNDKGGQRVVTFFQDIEKVIDNSDLHDALDSIDSHLRLIDDPSNED